MKRIAMAMAVIAGLGLFAQNARAVNPATVDIWVMLQNLSINVAGGSTWYDFGPVVTGSTNNVQALGLNFVVQNDGNVNETFQLRVLPVSNALVSGGGLWNLGVPGVETVRLSALFTQNRPLEANFTPATDALTTVAVSSGNADAAAFCFTDFAAWGGFAVAPAASRNLWTRIEAPTSTTQTTKNFLRLEINAVP